MTNRYDPPTHPVLLGVHVPAYYYSAPAGYCLVDPGLPLPPNIHLLLRPTRSPKLRNLSPDVILALLRQDEVFLSSSTPRFVFRNTEGRILEIPLALYVLRPRLQSILSEKEKMVTKEEIDEASRPRSRIIHVNGNRVDCRRENLRDERSLRNADVEHDCSYHRQADSPAG